MVDSTFFWYNLKDRIPEIDDKIIGICRDSDHLIGGFVVEWPKGKKLLNSWTSEYYNLPENWTYWPNEDSYLKRQELSGLRVGDTVRVTRKAKDYENGWDNCWVGEMDDFVGKTFEIIGIRGESGIILQHAETLPFNFNINPRFPYFVLELVGRFSDDDWKPIFSNCEPSSAWCGCPRKKEKSKKIEIINPRVIGEQLTKKINEIIEKVNRL